MKKLIPLIFLLAGTGMGVGTGMVLGIGSGGNTVPDRRADVESDTQSDPAATEHGAVQIEPRGDLPASDHAVGHEPTHHAGHSSGQDDGGHGSASHAYDYVKMTNQFVVPVVEGEKVTAMVVVSLSLEVSPGATEFVYALEPKLRDGFLQVLFDHANMGGFGGAFTDSSMMAVLRRSLLQIARRDLGSVVNDIMIVDIARQDV